MAQELPPEILDSLQKIGKQLRNLRNEKKLNYKTFAENELNVNKNTYFRMEQGKQDYNISNLLLIISKYNDIKLSDFLRDAGL